MASAPDFTLPDQAGRRWRLSDHRGRGVVLLFLRGDW
jgi:peroxiredoxin